MMKIKIKIKKLQESAIIPKYSKQGDAGMDLVAISKIYDEYGNVSYGTGISIEIPRGYVGLLFPRSSNCKKDLLLSNSVGIIDSGYRGEIFFKFKPSLLYFNDEESEPGKLGMNSDTFDYIISPKPQSNIYEEYKLGERIGQILILPYPEIEFKEVEELSETERGEGGFGSTGI